MQTPHAKGHAQWPTVILEYGKLAPPFTHTPSFAQKAFRWDLRIGFTSTLVPTSFCEGRTKKLNNFIFHILSIIFSLRATIFSQGLHISIKDFLEIIY